MIKLELEKNEVLALIKTLEFATNQFRKSPDYHTNSELQGASYDLDMLQGKLKFRLEDIEKD